MLHLGGQAPIVISSQNSPKTGHDGFGETVGISSTCRRSYGSNVIVVSAVSIETRNDGLMG